MELSDYKRALESIPFGKRLPSALYVFFEQGQRLGEPLDSLVAWVKLAFEISGSFNVLKFKSDELKISFLDYPSAKTALMTSSHVL